MNKYLKYIVPVIMLLGVNTCVTLHYSDTLQGKILKRFKQPENIDYKSYDPYVVLIREGNTQWRVLGWDQKTLHIHIVKSADFNYGHTIELDITGVSAQDIDVLWEQEGIKLNTKSGHQLWIPKKSFIGGR